MDRGGFFSDDEGKGREEDGSAKGKKSHIISVEGSRRRREGEGGISWMMKVEG